MVADLTGTHSVPSSRLRPVRLEPFVRVHGTPFTISHAELIRLRGPAFNRTEDDDGLNVLDFGDSIYRFTTDGTLAEVSLQASVVLFGNVAVPFGNLVGFIRSQDIEAFDRAGYLVSPAYGLSFLSYRPFWVTALARWRVAEWKARRGI